jgi:hypothetical protein
VRGSHTRGEGGGIEDSLSGSLEERVAGPGKRDTKLQGREGSTESLTRLGIGSDREEQEEKTASYNYVLISIPVLRMNAGTTCTHAREQLQ